MIFLKIKILKLMFILGNISLVGKYVMDSIPHIIDFNRYSVNKIAKRKLQTLFRQGNGDSWRFSSSVRS